MKERLLEYLRCFHCHETFELQILECRDDHEILEGTLVCAGCRRSYRVSDGVPRMMDDTIEQEKHFTAARFGQEWELFDDVGEEFERGLLKEYIHPASTDVFKGKLVLECGCGSGRNIIRVAEYGAREVIGVDLGSGVDVSYRKSRHLPNVHVIQCDMQAMPLVRDFDVVFSAGVLHHLPAPEQGFQSMLKHLKAGGNLLNNVYAKENNAWLERYVTPLRLQFTTRLPTRLLYYASWLISVPLYALMVGVYRPFNEVRSLKRFASKLFYNDYTYRMAKQPFRATWVQIHDQLTAPVAAFISREEIEGWVSRAAVKDMRFFFRNGNSWNFVGVKDKTDREYDQIGYQESSVS